MEIKKLDLKSMDIVEEKREQIKALFPEVFTEGNKIDFERLKLTLGEMVDPGKERYGMNWPGKADCFKIIQQPSIATLIPDRGESVDFDTTENLFIEGDNLEVLKLLQKAYFGTIKMICIDQPYNTGNDFIYPDDYSESLDTYLRYTGQIDNEGRKYSTNTEADGRFHSKWMNMMYPRLFQARNLLKADGVIFISIDEHEVQNLKSICNEVFGEENFIAMITVLCNPKGRSQDKYFATNHEYVLVYSKTTLPKGFFSIKKDIEQIEDEYPEEDEHGKFRLLELRNTHREFGKHNRKNLYYPIYVNPETSEVSIQNDDSFIEVLPIWDDGFEGCWTWEKQKAINDIDFLVAKKIKRQWKIFRKSYANGADKMLKTILNDKIYHTEKGQKAFNYLFGTKGKLFQSPKSVDLIRTLINTVTMGDKDIVLDFFGGSCTTAHATLEQNKEDGGNRRFIMVQLPEPTDENSEAFKAGYKTIADIGKERIRRVIKRIKEEQEKKTELFSSDKPDIDLGFKVFKLQPSNFKLWNGEVAKDKETIEKQLAFFVEHINPKSSQEDILYEILLKSGIPLTTKIEQITLAEKTVFSIADGSMFICLEKDLTLEVIRAMAEKKPVRVVCLDEGFKGNDQLKTNAVQIMKTRNITFRTV
ncbi:MAG: site-specific DNA-methyltransferase [Syntrophales bacterium]|nr:site-specific DNA-methyltransferase [Syntrophales bacterium]